VKHGTVYQRHLKACPRGEDGQYLPHRCRGRWSYMLEYGRDSNGRRLQTAKGGFPTKAAAQTALQERVRMLMADVSVHTLTVGDYLDTWLAGKQALKQATLANYRDLSDGYLKPHLASIPLLELRAHHLDAMYANIALGRRGRPLSPASLRRVHSVLRSALNAAVKKRLLPYSPAEHIELAPENPKRPRPWSVDECMSFLRTAKTDRLAFLYELLLVTGMRRGEGIGLRWDDIDLEGQALFVVQQIVDVGGRLVVGSPKTKRGSRVVPLDGDTVAGLRRHAAAQQTERLHAGPAWTESGLVFTRPDGQALRPEYVTKHFRVLAKQARLPLIRLHDLRHTNASLALQAGVPLKVVSERLGHSQTAITADLYTHVNQVVGREAASQIASVLRRRPADPEAVPYLSLTPGATEPSSRQPGGLGLRGTNEAPGRVSAAQGPDP
jgi:integrase